MFTAQSSPPGSWDSRRDASFKMSHMGHRLKNCLQPRLNQESVFLFADSSESTLWYHLVVMQTIDAAGRPWPVSRAPPTHVPFTHPGSRPQALLLVVTFLALISGCAGQDFFDPVFKNFYIISFTQFLKIRASSLPQNRTNFTQETRDTVPSSPLTTSHLITCRNT